MTIYTIGARRSISLEDMYLEMDRLGIYIRVPSFCYLWTEESLCRCLNRFQG